MHFREALKYVICQKRVEIMKKLAMATCKAESNDDEVESDDDPESEDKAEIGKESHSYERKERQDGDGMSFSDYVEGKL